MIFALIGAAQAATLDGRVLEHGSGAPVAGAEVSADGATVSTGVDGRFALPIGDLPVEVRVVSIDHRPLDLTVLDATEPLRVWLVPVAPPLEVVVESFRASASPSRHRVDAEVAPETPGALDDAVRLVQSLPGVTVQREYGPTAGDLVVRGASPGENRYLLDGIDLPYLYHFNQYASVYPTAQIDTLELYPSTFGAAFGDAVGAIVDVRTKAEAPSAVHGSLTWNLLMAGGDVRAPLGGGWWGSAALRRSYYDLVERGTAQYTLWPTFHDFSVRAQHDGAAKTALFAFGAGDAYARAAGELDALDPVEQLETPTFRHRRSFEVVGLERRWTGGGGGRAVAALVRDRVTGQLSTGGFEALASSYLSSRVDHEGGPGPVSWAAGGELRAERTSLQVATGSNAWLVADEAPALARGVPVDATMLRARGAVYGEGRLVAGAVRAFPALRIGVDSAVGALRADPRAALRWRALDQTELELAGGLYHQWPQTEDLFAGTGDPTLPPTRAWQLAAGVEQTIAGRLELNLETYGKILHDPIVHPAETSAVAAERGAAHGIELVARYRLRDRFFLSCWAAASRSLVEQEQAWAPADGDQPLVAGLVASWDPSPTWNIGLRYRYGSGLPYTDVVDAVYVGTDDSWIPVAGATNGSRMPAYHKLDVRASREWAMRSWTLEVAADIGWVPRAAAQLYPVWSYDFGERAWVVGPTLLPLVSLRARF